MKITTGVSDLIQGYEALRAQAVGEIPNVTPCGLAVLIRGGLPSWMYASAPTSRPSTTPAAADGSGRAIGLTSLSVELVTLLIAMALSCQAQQRCRADS